MEQVPDVPEGVDTGAPTPARIYDDMLRGGRRSLDWQVVSPPTMITMRIVAIASAPRRP